MKYAYKVGDRVKILRGPGSDGVYKIIEIVDERKERTYPIRLDPPPPGRYNLFSEKELKLYTKLDKILK